MRNKVRLRFIWLKSQDIRFRGKSEGLTIEYIRYVMEQPCAYCGAKYNEPSKMAIDRIDAKKGYRDDNIASACKPCNSSKNNSSLEFWLLQLERLLKREIPKALYLLYLP